MELGKTAESKKKKEQDEMRSNLPHAVAFTTAQLKKIFQVRMQVKAEQPLIHCITNPISINDCANVVLATGAKPIMAEHPDEVEEITELAKALAVNLGNITDARMCSIPKAGKRALEKNIPCIIDMVGVSCSKIRHELAHRFIHECHPAVIKGNITEIKAIFGEFHVEGGIDISKADQKIEQSRDGMMQQAQIVRTCAVEAGAVVLASGATDIISDGKRTFLIGNGTPMLADITGSGCMLNVLTASFLSGTDPLYAALFATAAMGICGELSVTEKGTGTFRTNLLDHLYTLSEQEFTEIADIIEIL